MAARTAFRGRKALFRNRDRFLFRGRWWKIVYFKGYELRHMNPDAIDILLWRGDGHQDFVPPGELWIDERYVSETRDLLEIFQIEKMEKWTTKGDNDRYPPYKRLRDYLKEKLCRRGPVPNFVVLEGWNDEHQVNVVYVRGKIVRRYFDPHFVFGGHDLIYDSYITTPRTIWIDVCQDPREIRYTLAHEACERKLMERGWRYDPAHARAIKLELKLRAAEYALPGKEVVPSPLPVVPIEQSETGCGTTSAKMMLDYDRVLKPDGAPYAEEDLIALCNCDPEFGTDHAPLVDGLRKIVGDRVVHGDGGTIDDLRRLVLLDRRPIMVGWWDGPHRTSDEVRADLANLDAGHYSVVVHVTRTHVWLADPWIVDPEDDTKSAPGIRKMRIKDFLEYWYDMDGYPTETDPGSHLVRGWYLYLRKA